jgi:endoglucanase Acf2
MLLKHSSLGSVCLHTCSRGFALDYMDSIYFHVSLHLKNREKDKFITYIQYSEYILPRYHGLIEKKCGAYMKFRDITDRKSISQNYFIYLISFTSVNMFIIGSAKEKETQVLLLGESVSLNKPGQNTKER